MDLGDIDKFNFRLVLFKVTLSLPRENFLDIKKTAIYWTFVTFQALFQAY